MAAIHNSRVDIHSLIGNIHPKFAEKSDKKDASIIKLNGESGRSIIIDCNINPIADITALQQFITVLIMPDI